MLCSSTLHLIVSCYVIILHYMLLSRYLISAQGGSTTTRIITKTSLVHPIANRRTTTSFLHPFTRRRTSTIAQSSKILNNDDMSLQEDQRASLITTTTNDDDNTVECSLLERIKALDASRFATDYVAFVVGDKCVGQILRRDIGLFLDCRDENGKLCFQSLKSSTNEKGESEDSNQQLLALAINERFKTYEERTKVMDVATQLLIDNQVIKKRHGDLYPLSVGGPSDKEIMCVVDRHTAPFFGLTSVGVHLLCYVKDGSSPKITATEDSTTSDSRCTQQQVSLWMAQRSPTKSYFASLWDPTVAGGHPVGLSLIDNVIKEAGEEAGISSDIVRKYAKSVSCLSQMTSKSNGTCLKQSLYYVWEMEVTTDFMPQAVDGEVAKFELWNANELKHEVRYGNRLRPAMRLVITDFLIRHGIITPDNEPDYARIQASMHRDRLILWNNK